MNFAMFSWAMYAYIQSRGCICPSCIKRCHLREIHWLDECLLWHDRVVLQVSTYSHISAKCHDWENRQITECIRVDYYSLNNASRMRDNIYSCIHHIYYQRTLFKLVVWCILAGSVSCWMYYSGWLPYHGSDGSHCPRWYATWTAFSSLIPPSDSPAPFPQRHWPCGSVCSVFRCPLPSACCPRMQQHRG